MLTCTARNPGRQLDPTRHHDPEGLGLTLTESHGWGRCAPWFPACLPERCWNFKYGQKDPHIGKEKGGRGKEHRVWRRDVRFLPGEMQWGEGGPEFPASVLTRDSSLPWVLAVRRKWSVRKTCNNVTYLLCVHMRVRKCKLQVQEI